jgi:uncharacterized protein (UPF0264 family)|tara:strand:- start:73 stop:819 length:747 start_codon:yes stop_codon:yes gene_type:complete
MTNILTSIKNIHEARLIRDMSIGIVDVKNVDDGALGFVGVEEAEKIFNFLRTKTLSITMGDYVNPAEKKFITNALLMNKIGFDFIKLGLFNNTSIKHHKKFLEITNLKKTKPVCVLFADKTFSFENLEKIIEIGYEAVMIDTLSKSKKTTNILDYSKLKRFVEFCKDNEILCGISGSVKINDLPNLLQIQPDFIGMRGQLCTSDLGRDKLDVKQVSNVLDEFNYALNKSNNGRTLSKVSLYSNSTSES